MEEQSEQPGDYHVERQVMKEWIVEYYVERSQNETLHCITILRGRSPDEVQTRLYSELRENFPMEFKLEVTVTRMVPIDIVTDESLFELQGIFQP